MKSVKTDKGFFIKLSKDEKVIERLLEFCEINNVTAGTIQGLGGASDITLGYYNLETKEYEWKTFPEVHEVLSLNGNVSMVSDKPFIHSHMVISNNEFQTWGGHLKEATVGATLEVFVTSTTGSIKREMDSEIGLNLLNIPED